MNPAIKFARVQAMHISGAHLHSHVGQPSASTASLAASHAEQTRKKLFAAADDLEFASTAEGAWMIGAWSGQNGSRHGHSSRESDSNGSNSEEPASRASASGAPVPTDLVLEQSAIAAAQANAPAAQAAASSYRVYSPQTPERVERIAEARQVSYWA